MRAVCITLDGEIVAVLGVARETDHGKVFSDIRPALEPYLGSITVWRAIKMVMTFVKDYKGPVIAQASNGEAAYQMMRLGFEHGVGEYWMWPN